MTAEKILIVDDSATIRRLVARNLSRSGYQVRTAVDGQQGLDLARKHRPDLILLDFVMPRMNGFHFCQALRKEKDLRTVPVIVMSAKGETIGERVVEHMGAVDALTKPFRPETLEAVTSHVLETRRHDPDGSSRLSQELAGFFADGEREGAEYLEDFRGESTDLAIDLHASSTPSGQLAFADGPAPANGGTAQMSLEEIPPWTEESVDGHRGQAMDVAPLLAAEIAALLSRAPLGLESGTTPLEERLAPLMTPASIASLAEVLAPVASDFETAAFAGHIGSVPLPEVFQLLELQSQTGRLEIRRDAFRVFVFFRRGRIDLAQARNGRQEFLFRRYVLQAGVVAERELERLLEISDDQPGALEHQLVHQGYLSMDDLRALLERQTEELMYEVLRWRRGRYLFQPDLASSEATTATLGLSTGALVLEGYRRVDEWRVIEKEIGDFNVVPHCDSSGSTSYTDADLTEEEATLLAAVDGRRSLRQIVDSTQMSSFAAGKLLYRLIRLKMIQTT